MSFLPKNFLDKPFFSKINLTSNFKDDSKMKFVAFSRDWADEFNVYGFALMTTEEWNEYSDKLKKADNVSWYFGTNEGYDDERGSTFLEDMEVTDITPEEADTLKRIFQLEKYGPFLTWGQFPEFDDIDNDGNVQDEW